VSGVPSVAYYRTVIWGIAEAANVKCRVLANTGLQVSELGLGGLFISSYGAGRKETRQYDVVPFRPFEEPFSLPFGGQERRGPGWAR
jgi:hypothetical protein